MSKKLTFKGLAVSAILALGLTGLTAIPSNAGTQTYGTGAAAGQVTLNPTTGTEWTVTSLDDFNVRSTFTNLAAGSNTSGDDLKWLVEDATVSSGHAADVLSPVYTRSVSQNDATVAVGASDRFTLTTGSHKFRVGDRVWISGTNTVLAGTDNDDDAGGPDVTDAVSVDLAGYEVVSAVSSTTVSFDVNTLMDNNTLTDSTVNLQIALATAAVTTGTDFSVNSSSGVITVSATGHDFDAGDWVRFAPDVEGAETFAQGVEINSTYKLYGAFEVLEEDGDSFKIAAKQTGTGNPTSGTSVLVVEVGDAAYNANGSFVYDSRQDSNAAPEDMQIENFSGATRSVNVTAFVDTTFGTAQTLNSIQTTEYASLTETVTFISADEIAATLTFATPALDATSLSATFTTVPVLNGDQVDEYKPVVGFTRQGSPDLRYGTIAWNNTTKVWTSTIGLTVGANWTGAVETANPDIDTVIPGTYTATVYIPAGSVSQYTTVNTATAAAISAATTQIVAARVAADLTATVVGSANTSPAEATGGNPGTATTSVRLGTASADVSVKVVDSTGAAVGAGKSVVATLSDSTNYKVNTATTATVQTNASGVAVFSVSKASASTTGTVVLTVVAEGLSAKRAEVTLNWVAASYSLFNFNETGSAYGTSGTNDVARTMNKGGTSTLSLGYVDQWKVDAPAGAYEVRVTNSGRTTSGTTQTVAFTGGRANVTITDNNAALSTGTTISSAIAVWKLAAPGAGLVSTTDVDFTVLDQTDAVVINGTAADEAKTAFLPLKSVVAADQRQLQTAAVAYHQYGTANEAGGDAVAQVAGLVRHAVTQAVRPYAVVTVSGDSGFLFRNGQVARKGSITVVAGSDGTFSVDVISNKAVKESVITVASNGASATTKVTFRPAMAQTGADVTWSQPKSIRAGKTLVSTMTLVDAWGNPVQVAAGSSAGQATYHKLAISYSGPGFVANQPVVTDAAGQAQIRVFLDERDWAPTTVSFYYVSGDGVAATTTNTVVSESRATWVGPIANAKAGAKKGRVVVEAYRAVGKTVKVFVGRTQVASFVADKANDSMVVRGIKSGTRNVRVVLSGPGEDFRGAITVK